MNAYERNCVPVPKSMVLLSTATLGGRRGESNLLDCPHVNDRIAMIESVNSVTDTAHSTSPSKTPIWVFSATGFLFAVLQSVCTFFALLGGLRVMLGATALVAASQAGVVWDHFHGDAIRWPMMIASMAGLLLSWATLRRVRRLRENPSSQWRRKPISARRVRFERWQYAFQIATAALLFMEEWMHLRTFHHF